MDEADEHPRFDLFDVRRLDQVRPDTPVLLGRIEHLIIDPSAARGLEQRMIEHQHETALRLEYPCNLGDHLINVVEMLEDETCQHGVGTAVGEGQLSRMGPDVVDISSPPCRDAQLVPRQVDPRYPHAVFGQSACDLAFATTEVDDMASVCELMTRHRDDLVAVLGIGTVGEAIDPPLRMRLPEIVHAPRLRAASRYDRRMHFSVWPNPARPTDEILELAAMADDNGWYGIWFADHYMPNTADGSVDDGDTHEAWAVLPAIAARTERVRVGPLVAPTTMHHPALLANRAASIDHLSGGRFVLGLGAGWQVNEHRAYGVELFEARARVDRFEEAIQIIVSLLGEPRTTFDGEHFKITDAPCSPKPLQSPLPILVGTGGPRMLRLTARYAQEWNTWGTPETAGRVLQSLERACDLERRDPATIHKSVQGLVFVTDDDATAERIRTVAPADRSLIGSVARLTELLGEYRDLGFDEVIIPDFTLGATLSERLAAYHLLRDEILPALSA